MPRHPRNRAPRIPTGMLAQIQVRLQARDAQASQYRPAGDRKPNVEVRNKADSGPAELRIYDAIGGWWGITATDVAEALDDIDADRDLTVRINSPGGDVFDGTAIYNLLRARAGTVNVVIDGLAASAASFIAQAGDEITMNRGTQMMIHDAIGFTIGNAADHREQVALLDRISDEIAGIYANRAGSTVEAWRERMLATTWYNAAEAVEAGLADQATDDQAEADDDEEAEQEGAQGRAAASALPAVAAAEELTDQEWAAIGESFRVGLDEAFDGMEGYDPAMVGGLIADVYGDAPAPPAVEHGPPPVRTSIPIGEFVDAIVAGIQEGVRP